MYDSIGRINNFNPRSLTGATEVRDHTNLKYRFQSTLPYGSDFSSLFQVGSYMIFQSTLPYGSDLLSPRVRRLGCHFNPRSLTGATEMLSEIQIYRRISIHAPSRERLNTGVIVTSHLVISIHAPSRERLPQAFNSAFAKCISIHAPSRERLLHYLWAHLCGYFNPRSLAGATLKFFFRFKAARFQSTLPRGSDIIIAISHFGAIISIHAPSRERQLVKLWYNKHSYFNPRSLAGATTVKLYAYYTGWDFNPRSLAGATVVCQHLF